MRTIDHMARLAALPTALLLSLLLLLAGCGEDVENDQGLILLPSSLIGELPRQLELRRPESATALTGPPTVKGGQVRIFVGHTEQYEMRTLLGFRVVLPAGAELTAAKLNLYVVDFSGFPPTTLYVHQLEQQFEEAEASWEQAATGRNWSSPGGGIVPTPLGQGVVEAARLDTVVVELDLARMNAWLAQGDSTLPLAVLGEDKDALVGMVAKELYPTAAVASRLDLEYTSPGVTGSQFLERRSFQDSYIVNFKGQAAPEGLLVGDVPTGQLFLQYDLSQLPALSTVNRALLRLSLRDLAVSDSFWVATRVAEALSPVEYTSTIYSQPQAVNAGDSVLELDVTLPLQRILLAGGTGRYLVLTSYTQANSAGYLQIWSPEAADTLVRPVLKLVFSEVPEALKP